MISYKVMKIDEFNDSVFYRIACGCGDRDHDFELWLEYDKDINDITLMIEKTLYWSSHYQSWPWYERMYKRFSSALRLIFYGHLKIEADILFMKKEHIEGFIEALKDGMTKIEKNDSKEK